MKKETIRQTGFAAAVLIAVLMIFSCTPKDDKTMPVTSSSKEAKVLFREAVAQMFDNNSKKATELLKKAIDLDKNFVLANLYYGYSGFGSIDREKFLNIALENINSVSETEKHITNSFIAYSKGNLVDAVKEIKAAIELSPNDKFLTMTLSNIYSSYGQYDNALEYANKTIELDSLLAGAVNTKGYLLWRLNKTDEAEKMYRKSIEMNPSNLSFYNNYGQLLRGAGRIDEAIAMHRKALEIEPDYTSFLFLGHCFVAKEEYPTARENYMKAYEAAENNGQKSFCLESVGYTYLYEKDLTNALASFDKRAEFNRQLGKMDAEIVNSIISKFSASLFYNDLGNAEKYLSDAKGLISSSELTETDRKDYIKYFVLLDGFLMAKQGKNEEAEKNLDGFEKSLNDTEKDIYTSDLLELKGLIQLNKKNYDEAISSFWNDSPVSKYYAGLTYEKIGKTEKAKEIFSVLSKINLTSFPIALVKPFAKEKLAVK